MLNALKIFFRCSNILFIINLNSQYQNKKHTAFALNLSLIFIFCQVLICNIHKKLALTIYFKSGIKINNNNLDLFVILKLLIYPYNILNHIINTLVKKYILYIQNLLIVSFLIMKVEINILTEYQNVNDELPI